MAANKSMRDVNRMFMGLEPTQIESKKSNQEIKEVLVPAEELKKISKAKDPGSHRRIFPEDAVTKFVNVQLLESEVKFLEKYGGEFGGKTGYIRRLVQQEMARVIDE